MPDPGIEEDGNNDEGKNRSDRVALVGRARYGGEATILTHYGAPAAVVISFEDYQRVKHAHEKSGSYDLPPEIIAQ